MNFFKKLFKNLSVTDEKAWNTSLWRFPGSVALSGEVVTEETALSYSAVWNAVTLISGTVATLPLHLYSPRKNKKEIVVKHPLYRLMHDEANEFMSAMAFRETLMSHVLLWGNGYAEIVRDGVGKVVALWPITPNRVRIDVKSGRPVYVISVAGEQIYLPKEQVLHLAGLGFDGLLGYSPVAMARKSIGLGMAMETFGSNYFGNGTHPGVIVSHPGKLSGSAQKNLKDSLTSGYSGLGKSHRLLLLEEGMKMESVGVPPEDSQFLESRQFQIPEIARWYNLPPHKLKDLSKSSFNNIESEQISFVTDSILPWLIRSEQCFNMQLLSKREKEIENLYFKHVVEGLLRGDSKSRGDFYKAMFSIGAMSQNDIRAKEDMDPIENGDEYYVPLNMIPASMVREVLLKDTQKSPEIGETDDEDNEPQSLSKPKIRALPGGE